MYHLQYVFVFSIFSVHRLKYSMMHYVLYVVRSNPNRHLYMHIDTTWTD